MNMDRKSVEALMLTRGRLYVPTYQRRYTWKREHVIRLLDDIEKVIANLEDKNFKHYIGTVYIQDKDEDVWELIDGQQRMTTIHLIMTALVNRLTDRDGEEGFLKKTWTKNYLMSKDEETNKIKLTYDDEIEMNKIRDEGDTTGSSQIKTNYRLIEEYLDEYMENERDLEAIVKAMDRLELIEVTLDDKDNAQEIFDGINATGVALTVGDQVKNYLFMGRNPDEQEDLYHKFWRTIEVDLGSSTNFGVFLKVYLTIKNEAQLRGNSKITLYGRYLEYMEDNGVTKDAFIEDFRKYFDIKKQLENVEFENTRVKKVIRRVMYDLAKNTNILGFLMQLTEYYNNERIDTTEYIEVIKQIEGYNLRKILTGTKGGSTDFYSLLHKRGHVSVESNGTYLDGIKETLRSGIKSAYLSDLYVLENVEKNSIYTTNTKNTLYVLERIENGHSVEQIDIYTEYDNKEFSIEHIMPQTLSDSWKTVIGTAQLEQVGDYIHTLGNLTITGYNSRYKNHPFREKVEMLNGMSESRFTNLNRDVVTKPHWDISAIRTRSKEMAQVIIELYPY